MIQSEYQGIKNGPCPFFPAPPALCMPKGISNNYLRCEYDDTEHQQKSPEEGSPLTSHNDGKYEKKEKVYTREEVVTNQTRTEQCERGEEVEDDSLKRQQCHDGAVVVLVSGDWLYFMLECSGTF